MSPTLMENVGGWLFSSLNSTARMGNFRWETEDTNTQKGDYDIY